MNLTIKYFASIREAIGAPSESLQTNVATLAELRDALIARGGPHAESLARGRAVRMALNQVMSEESAALVDGAEVAFFSAGDGRVGFAFFVTAGWALARRFCNSEVIHQQGWNGRRPGWPFSGSGSRAMAWLR